MTEPVYAHFPLCQDDPPLLGEGWQIDPESRSWWGGHAWRRVHQFEFQEDTRQGAAERLGFHLQNEWFLLMRGLGIMRLCQWLNRAENWIRGKMKAKR